MTQVPFAEDVFTWPADEPQLIGAKCEHCGATTFPIQDSCPRCGRLEMTRRLLPQLRRARSGRLVFVSSVLAFTGSTHGAHYAAAKAGIIGLARSLARELAPTITVNVVAPGAIDTAILAADTPAQRAERSTRIPLGRVGTPEEVADAISYLISPRASYITGTVLHVNGGAFLG